MYNNAKTHDNSLKTRYRVTTRYGEEKHQRKNSLFKHVDVIIIVAVRECLYRREDTKPSIFASMVLKNTKPRFKCLFSNFRNRVSA